MTLQLKDLLTTTGGHVVGEASAQEFARLASDVRLVRPGDLFVAALTPDGDGHDDLAGAVHAGATGLLVERLPEDVPQGVTVIQVSSMREALRRFGRNAVERSGADIVAVAGSVGKTLTRALIAHLLADRMPVFQADGGAYGLVGLPVALSELPVGKGVAVLEIGCRSMGEVRDLAVMIAPRIAAVTALDESGIEALGSMDTIAREYSRLAELLPSEGRAVLNADDSRVRALSPDTDARKVWFGESERAMVRAETIRPAGTGVQFTMVTRAGQCAVKLPLAGAHMVPAALAAAAVALEYGLSPDEIAARLATFAPLPGRMCPLEAAGGGLILDDTNGSGPLSVLGALDALHKAAPGRRIAVLGGVTGLGESTREVNVRIAKKVAQVADQVIGYGDLGREIALEAVRAGLSRESVGIAYTSEDAAALAQRSLKAGAAVLVNGPASARMERIVARLMAHPEQARERLVRQGQEWQAPRPPHRERATWIEVDLEAIANNVRQISRMVGKGVEVMAVVKANAYGLGAVKVGQTAINNGATSAGVACMGEAIELRDAGITAPILVLGYTPPWAAREMVRYKLSAALYSMEVARALSQAALDLGDKAHVHVKVDSGMGRLGLLPDQVLPFLRQIKALPGLDLEGIFSHYAAADEEDLTHAHGQLRAFTDVVEAAKREGFRFRWVHASNSGGTIQVPEGWFNMVRPGTLMMGMHPSADVPRPPEFRNAFALKCEIAQVKRLPKGSTIGYGCTYVTPGPRTIAVVPVGYADGVRRAPIHWGEVLVHGRRVPFVGRICMDQAMVDVTDIPGVRPGDEAVLIGRQGDAEITMDEVAVRIGTIINEVTSGLLSRVPRLSEA